MFEIGKITTTHGIKGELKVVSLSDFDRFKKNEKMFIVKDNQKIELTVENIKNQVNNLIVKFKEFNNINEVLDFRGLIIYSNTRGKLNKNEFYYESLYDLEVYNVNDNSYIGKVTDIVELPHGKLLEIYNEDKKILIPFVDEFIVEVTDTKIVIKPIEGLLWLLILLRFFLIFLMNF